MKNFLFLLVCGIIISGCSLPFLSNENNICCGEEYNDQQQINQESEIGQNDYSINLTSPQSGQVLKSPFLVGGETSLAGENIYIRVKNPRGDVLISEQTRIEKNTSRGVFSILINFAFQTTGAGTVEIYGLDGEEEVGLVTVPVKFDLGE